MTARSAEELLVELNRMKEEQGVVRARAAAEQLGVPEAALLEAREHDGSVRRLSVSGMDVAGLIERMPEVGDVMVLTRNDHCVHEKTGTFENMRFNTHMGSAFGKEIDLRMFLGQWKTGFYVTDPSPKLTRHSLQFFDKTGAAAFKIYAVGGNTEAARLAGLRVALVRGSTYAICSACAAIAGMIMASRLDLGQADMGRNIALDSIAVVVIGGTSLSGGRGSVAQTAVGLMLVAVLTNLLDSLAVSANYQLLIKGTIVVAAVALDAISRRNR